jgi:hypothetical protein
MIHPLRFAIVFVASGLPCCAVFAADDKPADEKAAVSGAAQFEEMKKLVGVWKGTAAHGHEGEGEATVIFKLTGAGSALVETLFPGTGHEMVTVYHLDGDDLVLTHYCAVGNQPKMKAVRQGDPKKIEFRFHGGANIDPAKDLHMHDATIEFLDDDHFRAQWVSHSEGKAGPAAKFDMKRVKEKE